jgi:hypothetical protein
MFRRVLAKTNKDTHPQKIPIRTVGRHSRNMPALAISGWLPRARAPNNINISNWR